jgi:glucose-6-phosphate dehydrogenase assembly protein OpcA
MEPFLRASDRLVVDSGTQDDNLQFFTDLLGLMNDHSNGRCEDTAEGRVQCSDLNWRRSLPWRESVALAFDRRHSDLSPDYLSGITEVEIRFGTQDDDKLDGEGLINQSLLIVAWLASRLAWKLKSATRKNQVGYEISFTSSAASLAVVSLNGVPSDEAGVGDIGSIRVHCNAPEKVSIVAIQQKGMPGIGVKSVHGAQSDAPDGGAASLFELDEPNEGALIDKELESPGRDLVFRKSVQIVVEILQMLSASIA